MRASRFRLKWQERKHDGLTKESLRDAIKSVMNKDSELVNRVRKNHTKSRKTITSPQLMNSYVDDLIESFKDLIAHETNHD